MDYSRLDPVRRSATPIELDLVESFAQGRITRRQFIQRASVIGLSLPVDQRRDRGVRSRHRPSVRRARAAAAAPARARAPSASASAATGGTIRCAIQRPVSVDPVAMQDLGGYGIVAQSFEFLCTQQTDRRSGRPRPGSRRDVDAQRGRHGLDVQAPPGRQVAERRLAFTAADVVATMERLVAAGNSGLKGVLEPGGAVATDDTHRDVHARRRQRQLPVPRLDLQRADGHHAGRLRGRHDRRRAAGRDRRLEARQLQPADRRDVRAQPGLVGRPDAARRHRVPLLRRRPGR